MWRDIDHWSRSLQGRALTESEQSYLACGAALGRITTGCNILIFVAAHKKMTIIPISAPRPGPQRISWVSIAASGAMTASSSQ